MDTTMKMVMVLDNRTAKMPEMLIGMKVFSSKALPLLFLLFSCSLIGSRGEMVTASVVAVSSVLIDETDNASAVTAVPQLDTTAATTVLEVLELLEATNVVPTVQFGSGHPWWQEPQAHRQ